MRKTFAVEAALGYALPAWPVVGREGAADAVRANRWCGDWRGTGVATNINVVENARRLNPFWRVINGFLSPAVPSTGYVARVPPDA